MGLLGTAHINRLLIPAIRASGRSVVYGVGSRDAERASAYAAAWSIPQAFGSYEALVASDADIIYIPLPNSLHVPWSLRALAAGKHVLCEKPLALTPEDVDALAHAAADAGRVVTEGFMYRHHEQMRRIEALVAGGALGELRSIQTATSYRQNRAGDVRLVPDLGGGALWDIGCYGVGFAHAVAGARPADVTGVRRTGPTGVDEEFAATISYRNGVVAHVFCSFRAAYQQYARLIGSEAVLEIDWPFRPHPLERLRLRRDRTVEEVIVEGRPIFEDEVLDMEDAALGIRAPRITLTESRALAETLQALHRSTPQ